VGGAKASVLQDLQRLGQSPWIDTIHRGMLTSGSLARMIRAGDVTGLTSNPTIFEQAIARSADYDEALAALVRAGKPVEAIVDHLMIADVQAAADLFRPVYQRTKRADGYVSIEIAPTLAHDTDGSIREAARIWRAVNRPNLLVKIPATKEGVPAIAATIAAGINVNVTLIFSLQRYQEVMEAYLEGLTRRLEAGTPIDRIASVASFFVSRVDSAVDRQLEDLVGTVSGSQRTAIEQLRGKAAIANAKLAYARFCEVFESDHFAVMARSGARRQRPLWASTSAKNPAYPDVYYVEALIGANTVNTLPLATLQAYKDHGVPEPRIDLALDRARSVLAQLGHLGIDLAAVTAQLETEGVAAFAASYASLHGIVASRREAVLVGDRTQVGLRSHAAVVTRATTALDEAQVGARLMARDTTLWRREDPDAQVEIAARLGWLDLPTSMAQECDRLAAFAASVRRDGFTHAVLCGMGGSSLAPAVLLGTLGVASGFLDLMVLDSTDPITVREAGAWSDPQHTLYLVSSKSGTTTEVQAFYRYFHERLRALGAADPGRHFVAITDPGTPLEHLATEDGFREIFLSSPEVGGRFSALSLFGLVPAALIGADLPKLLDRAARMLEACRGAVRAEHNPGLLLGAILASMALRGRDKVTLLGTDRLRAFLDWAEQLLAESTGKNGKGLVPIVAEPEDRPSRYGNDRQFIHVRTGTAKAKPLASLTRAGHPGIALRLNDGYDLGGEFVRWEIATATAAVIFELNPFDQPDVQATKEHTRRALLGLARNVPVPRGPVVDATSDDLPGALAEYLRRVRKRSYVALCAFFAPNPERDQLLDALRAAILARHGIATTVGYGPRYLHSTGQLHKGGPTTVLPIILTADDVDDEPIPGTDYTFGMLKAAQADGDAEALRQAERPVLRLHFGEAVEAGLERVRALVEARPARRSVSRAAAGH